jgi:hypothetical protein
LAACATAATAATATTNGRALIFDAEQGANTIKILFAVSTFADGQVRNVIEGPASDKRDDDKCDNRSGIPHSNHLGVTVVVSGGDVIVLSVNRSAS